MGKRRRPDALPLLDGHNDTLVLRLVRGDPVDFAVRDAAYQVDLPRMRKGGMGGVFAMVGDCDLRQSLRLIDAVHRMSAAHPRDFALCLTAADVRRAMRARRIGLVMSIEGQAMFGEHIENVRNWHRLGVRVAGLTHGEGKLSGAAHALQIDASFFGYITPSRRATLLGQSKGLTSFARESLDVMAELNIPCDVAHVNDRAFWQVIEHAKGPVCYTHGNCYALCPHSRNLTDEMMKALAERGGVMGLCFYPGFIDEESPTVDRLAEHFLHGLEIMGPECVAVGTDFDGIRRDLLPVIKSPAHLPELWRALERKGVSRRTLKKIASENFLRLLP